MKVQGYRAPLLDERWLRLKFDGMGSFTVGVEDELILVDPVTLEPLPAIDLALDACEGDPRVSCEFRAAMVECITPVCVSVADIARELASIRRQLITGLAGRAKLIAAGVHPSAERPSDVTQRPRYRDIAFDQPWAARHLMACGLHVHVAVGGAERALAVYNALRSYLPEILALGANAPFEAGVDAGVASVRPLLNRSVSRFGVPPAFPSWREYAEFLAWGAASGSIADPSFLWWDLRLHPKYGTIEVRAADTQTRVDDAVAITAFVQALVFTLASEYDAGMAIPIHSSERINENMWLATRDGLNGKLADLETGETRPASERIGLLVARLRPAAIVLGCAEELESVQRILIDRGGAARQRTVARGAGLHGVLQWLASETSGHARPRQTSGAFTEPVLTAG